jgi:hypothetical protein
MKSRGFPMIRIFDSIVSREISSLIIHDALEGGIPNLPLGGLPLPIREAARRFMSQGEVSGNDHDLIFSHCAQTTILKGILLLRGLLMDGEGILGYVLKERRWRVDYGLDPSRTLLAVPYRAKVRLLVQAARWLLTVYTGRTKPESRVQSPGRYNRVNLSQLLLRRFNEETGPFMLRLVGQNGWP